ncbi:MAG: LytTR family DNA-binding domain-containing protein [Eubacteriales bacterium]|nr:LytTR family DNA-binding domain-containing protein [Eubacteriales bacterium]
MIKIAVCDDIEFYAKQIKEILLANQQVLNGEQQDIHIFTDGEKLCEYAKKHQLDQIYLDIDMPDINGMEVACYIRETLHDSKVGIIFVTGTSEHVKELFDYQPFGYIEKPIDERKLVNISRRLYELKHVRDRKFSFKANGISYNIFCHQLIYLQKEGHNIVLNWYSEDKMEYTSVRGTVKEMEDKLPCDIFVKISSSVIVNMQYIDVLSQNDVILRNGQILSMSRGCKKDVRDRWLDGKM